MNKSKKIKDPLYGYITVEGVYLSVMDSVYFQRLRHIIQTSYTSIYPSAVHNRFTHSLGVYWLGNLAFESLLKNSSEVIKSLSQKEIETTKQTFVLACLCHDLGHSPFSHTGEKFYDIEKISKELLEEVHNNQYKKDLDSGRRIVGKEHEIMSALLAIKKFGVIIGKDNFALFARCIIGLQYGTNDKISKKRQKLIPLYRACVELLNSNIIDVDKLDYLIRDSYMSGYASVTIDYKRLLEGVFINNGTQPVGYEKSALSVLEAVLTAHDMERRWIQSHPVVQYEAYLLQTVIREIGGKYNTSGHALLSFSALTDEGETLNGIGKIRLLSDADILFLAKQNYEQSDAVKEYCDRSLRRHPIWKTEAEFSLLFNFQRNDTFIETIQRWEQKLLEGYGGVYSLNETFFGVLKKEAEELENLKNTLSDASQKATVDKKIVKLNTELGILSQIRDYMLCQGFEFDLVIISQQQFKSNIYKSAFKELPIRFNSISNEIKQMHEASFIPLDIQENNRFFYMYYKCSESQQPIDVNDFSKMLRKASII